MAKHTKPSRKPNSFLNKPIYEGGIKAMRELIKANLKYPKEAIQEKVEGSVKIRYDIDYKGNVIKTKVIKGLGHGCDEEAQRLVRLFKFKIDKTRKVRVIFHKNIQINFKLPKAKPKPAKSPSKPNMSIQYKVTQKPTANTPREAKKEGGSSYSYTINIG